MAPNDSNEVETPCKWLADYPMRGRSNASSALRVGRLQQNARPHPSHRQRPQDRIRYPDFERIYHGIPCSGVCFGVVFKEQDERSYNEGNIWFSVHWFS